MGQWKTLYHGTLNLMLLPAVYLATMSMEREREREMGTVDDVHLLLNR